MRLKTACALGALVLAAVNAGSSALATSVGLEGGYVYNESWGGMMPSTRYDMDSHMLTVPGGRFSGSAYGAYSYDLSLGLVGGFSGVPGAGPVTGTYSGTYVIYLDGAEVSAGTVDSIGTVRMDAFEEYAENPDTGEWEPTGELEYWARGYDFAGQFVPTSGTILGFGAGPVGFQGELGFDGFAFFWGSLDDTLPTNLAPAAVPLPGSAAMGLGLVGLLGAARRRCRVA